MKVLKFEPKLIPLILNGSKTATWRLFDNKDLKEGDDLEFKILLLEKYLVMQKYYGLRKNQ